MEEPHGETLHLQGFAAAAIDDDLVRVGQHAARMVDRALIDARQHGAEFAESLVEKIVPRRPHENSAIRSRLRS